MNISKLIKTLGKNSFFYFLNKVKANEIIIKERTTDEVINLINNNLLNEYKINLNKNICKPIFILSSPRTGSTLLYQLMCKYLNIQYFTNITETLLKKPLLAWYISSSLVQNRRSLIECKNNYGVSHGSFGPTEATQLFQNWFNYKHPSEIYSSDFISYNAKEEMQKTFQLIESISGTSLLTKNTWNCFRIKALSAAFPNARFIHLKRNIIDSSLSTLQARKTRGDPKIIWDSASPSNLFQLKTLPSHEQVVEQQFLTNAVVTRDLPINSSITVNYEDLLHNPIVILKTISNFLEVEINEKGFDLNKDLIRKKSYNTNSVLSERKSITEYCKKMNYII